MTRELLTKRLRVRTRKQLEISDFPGYRRAGVLVPLFPTTEGYSVLLTLRTDSVESHKGQVSFPGGMMDSNDRDIVETAVREVSEEIGLGTNEIEILGLLDDVPVPSQFLITPVVGYLKMRPVVRPSEIEVAEVFDVPLAFFGDERNARKEERELEGRRYPLWFFEYSGRTIWGATAGILRNLAEVVRGDAEPR
jgi:8-oxo-dGTP pyrophosphatase MutT (NUDIX family)